MRDTRLVRSQNTTPTFSLRWWCRLWQVLFVLSWRLGPVLALVIVATAGAVAGYRKQTKAVEVAAGNALSRMVAVADQAFRGITTVR